MKYLKRRAKKALKNSGLIQVKACIEMGISVPVYKNAINKGELPKDLEKRKSIENFIIKWENNSDS